MKKLTAAVMSICWAVSMGITTFAYEDGDWQFWNTESIEGNLAEYWKIILEQQFRFGHNIGELYHHYTDFGLTYIITGWFHLGLNYRQIYEKKNVIWNDENRTHVNGTLIWKWRELKFKDRNRFEYRIHGGGKDVWRYRNKVMSTIPAKWARLNIQAYLADEIFVDFDEGKLSRNRLSGGLKAELTKHLNADIFYLWQASKKDENWIDYNIIGAKLKVMF